jgi:hypothetical protein
MFAFIAAAVLFFSQTATAASSTVNLDGIAVPQAQVQALISAFLAAKTSGKISVEVDRKPDASMPAYDPHWHYVESSVNSTGGILSEVWICQSDVDASKTGPGKHEAAVEIAAGILLAVMDSGYAGPYWKQFYDVEASRDKNDAASTGNPSYHRDTVAVQIASAMLP